MLKFKFRGRDKKSSTTNANTQNTVVSTLAPTNTNPKKKQAVNSSSGNNSDDRHKVVDNKIQTSRTTANVRSSAIATANTTSATNHDLLTLRKKDITLKPVSGRQSWLYDLDEKVKRQTSDEAVVKWRESLLWSQYLTAIEVDHCADYAQWNNFSCMKAVIVSDDIMYLCQLFLLLFGCFFHSSLVSLDYSSTYLYLFLL